MSNKRTTVKMENDLYKLICACNPVLKAELEPHSVKGYYTLRQSYLQMLLRFVNRRNERYVVTWGMTPSISPEEVMSDVTHQVSKVQQEKANKAAEIKARISAFVATAQGQGAA